jgi:steroid 5-alpha reductase family enzyme
MLETFFLLALVVFGYVTVIFFLALIKRDNSIMDIAWGSGFVVVSLFTFLSEPGQTLRQILITALVVLWGSRLSIHIALRNLGKGEDYRYAKWRRDWGKWFLIRSYFQIFILQGFFMLIISTPVILVNRSPNPGLGFLDHLGIFIWAVGFGFESVGDLQLARFKREAKNKGRIMKTGLWRFTRHPNYFGEVTMWWGVFLLSLSVPNGWAGIISPLLITFLLLKVSGVAMLEKKYRGDPHFERYAAKTSPFFPWFPKKTV